MTAIGAVRVRARAAVWAERLARALWPALTALAAYAIYALLDGPRWSGALWPYAPALFLAVATIATLVLATAALRIARPDAASIDRRIEDASGLVHRPLATLSDRPAPGADAGLWDEHVRRTRAQLGRLRAGAWRPGVAAADRFGVRGLAIVGLGASIIVAGSDAPGRLWRGIAPGWPGTITPATAIQAWVRPPAYTGLPPRLVTGPALVAPIGSRLTISVTGAEAVPTLLVNAAPVPFQSLDRTSFQADRVLDAPGLISVRRRGEVLASWSVTIIPDAPPQIEWTEPPVPIQSTSQPIPRLRVVWDASDDYGLVSAGLEMRLAARPDRLTSVALPPVRGRTAHGTTPLDLSAHPWAGLPVMAQLVARDALDQAGRSDALPITLPERVFKNPLARAIVGIRRELSLIDPADPAQRAPAQAALITLADDGAWAALPAGLLVNLRAAGSLLEHGHDPNTVEVAQERLWALALTLEEDALDRTSRALTEAEAAVQEALAPDADPEAKAELNARIEALREAVAQALQALAELPREQADPNRPAVTPRDLARSTDRLQEAAREGRMDDARREMAELERQLEMLQNARPGDAQNAEKREAGRQQMEVVQDILKRQGALLDSTTARGAVPGSPPTAAEADERQQRALRRVLGEMMQQYGDLTGEVPPPLGEADVAMKDAADALGRQRDVPASAAQQRAIAALQKGAQSMSQQLAMQFGDGEGEGDGEGSDPGDQSGPGPGNKPNRPGNRPGAASGRDGRTTAQRRDQGRDPLGRSTGQNSRSSDGDVRVPDQMEAARGRALQDELRLRGQDRSRPRPELEYIDRLLAPFR